MGIFIKLRISFFFIHQYVSMNFVFGRILKEYQGRGVKLNSAWAPCSAQGIACQELPRFSGYQLPLDSTARVEFHHPESRSTGIRADITGIV
jgi:hypothetical protein